MIAQLSGFKREPGMPAPFMAGTRYSARCAFDGKAELTVIRDPAIHTDALFMSVFLRPSVGSYSLRGWEMELSRADAQRLAAAITAFLIEKTG